MARRGRYLANDEEVDVEELLQSQHGQVVAEAAVCILDTIMRVRHLSRRTLITDPGENLISTPIRVYKYESSIQTSQSWVSSRLARTSTPFGSLANSSTGLKTPGMAQLATAADQMSTLGYVR